MESKKYRKKLTPRTDAIFKNIFGKEKNKKILEDFLESILEEKVKVIRIEKSSELPTESAYLKDSTLDIKAILEGGEIVNIEMQNSWYSHYNKRVTYYLSKLISSQIEKGEDYEKINNVISINILNYKLAGMPNYISRCDINNGEGYNIDTAKIYFIQLPRFVEERNLKDPNNKYEDIVKSKLDQWCVFLSNKNKEVTKMAGTKNINLEEAIRQYEELCRIPGVVDISFRRQLAEMDRRVAEREAKRRGRKEGIKEGIKEGRKEGIRQGYEKGRKVGIEENKKYIAKQLLEQKVNMQIIINATGLTKEEIENC